jgi:hypothetical protein
MEAGPQVDKPFGDGGTASGDQVTQAAPESGSTSDRGVQYASAECVAILKKHGIVPRMSRPTTHRTMPAVNLLLSHFMGAVHSRNTESEASTVREFSLLGCRKDLVVDRAVFVDLAVPHIF